MVSDMRNYGKEEEKMVRYIGIMRKINSSGRHMGEKGLLWDSYEDDRKL
jgi:hypothetical protein